MKKESNKELLEYKDLVQKLGSVKGAPKLSRTQKKRMLHTAMGTQSLWSRMQPVAVSFAVLLLLTTSLLTFISKPGDTLYALKRKVEDARSKVQPSYDDTLIQRRQDEIEDLKNRGADEDDIQKAEDEKQKIEDRRSGKRSNSSEVEDDSGSNSTSTEIEDESEDRSETEHNDDSKSTDSSTEQSHNSSTNDDTSDSSEHEEPHQESTPQVQQNNVSRDACKAALDLRKKNGENINSDEYKKCD